MSLRAYLPPENWTDASFQLSREETHHITSVRRASIGDTVIVMDGCGRIATTRLASLSNKASSLDIIDVVTHPRPKNPMVLAPAMMNGTRWDWLLQKAAELGAASFFPLITHRTQERKKVRLDRWQNICVASIKQSGNPWLPELHEPTSLKAFLSSCEENDLLLYGDQNSDTTEWRQNLSELSSGQRIVSFTGPEGGYTEEELSQLKGRGACPVMLGAHTLRAETAALSFLAGISMTIQASSV